MNFTGTGGNDDLIGTVDEDSFDMTQGGKDRVQGLDGSDVFFFGSKLTDADKVDGGTGLNDTLALVGDYSGGLIMRASTMANMDQLQLAAGFSYDITIVDANTAGAFLVAATVLSAGQTARFDASADTDTDFDFTTGAGDDVLIGGAGNDAFVLGEGNDTGFGGAGVDNFNVFGFFGAGDSYDGGDDTDFLALEGDYSAGLTITKEMLRNVEIVQLAANSNFELTIENKVVADGETMSFDTNFLGAGNTVTVDASAAQFGNFFFNGGTGDDTFLGGGGSDSVFVDDGGNDVADGNGGDDEVRFGTSFTRDDRADGGGGHDIMRLDGDYSAGVEMRAASMTGFEEFIMEGLNSYNVVMHDENVGAGKELLASAASLNAFQSLVFDGRDELDGTYQIEGGAGDDTIFAGNAGGIGDVVTASDGNDIIKGFRGDDTIFAGTGDDTITGGKGSDFLDLGDVGDGADFIALNSVTESTGSDRDTVVHFNTNFDRFDLNFFVSGFDATVSATLSEATFDADLEAAIGNPQLARDHGVLFVANGGDLAGHQFIIVDANSHAGYQAGKDFVIEATVVGAVSNAIFI